MRRATLAICLVSACAPSSSPASTAPSSVPTPRSEPTTAAGPVAAPAAAPSDCRAIPPDGPTTEAVFVALADLGGRGVAFVLDAASAAPRGRIEIAGPREGVLDPVGGQLLLLCADGPASQLVSYDITTLRERWRTRIEDRQLTHTPGGIPALAVSADGDLVVVMHYKALRPGDANAPGASRYWLSAHHARGGRLLAEVELPECGVGSVHAMSSTVLYVLCRDGLRVIDGTSWRVARVHPVPTSFRPVALAAEERFYGVSRELRVVGMDMRSGTTIEDSSWSDGAGVANAWGHLAIAPDGSRLWVLTKRSGYPDEFGPDTLTAIDLIARRRTDTPVAELRGVGLVGARVVYVAAGRLRSTDGAFDVSLLSDPVQFWHILTAPRAQSCAPAQRDVLHRCR